jgi:3-methyladenine DNA glycosylase/8-oxoguanine DNA glycosylase
VPTLQAAISEVASRDPVLAHLVTRVGPIRHRPRDPDGSFAALVRAIVFQQLAGRAAQAIYGRVRATAGGVLTPERLNAVADADLRAAGLSRNKLASLRDLSTKVLDGAVVLTRTSRRRDDELIRRLTSVRGIGRWTAEMYLMFQLRRLVLAGRRSRRSPGLRARVEARPTADAERTRPIRRSFPPLPLGRRPLLLGSGAVLRPGGTAAALR